MAASAATPRRQGIRLHASAMPVALNVETALSGPRCGLAGGGGRAAPRWDNGYGPPRKVSLGSRHGGHGQNFCSVC